MPDVTLYQFAPLPGLLSISPFCCKVHMAFRLRNLEYKCESIVFPTRVNPLAQLPFVSWDGTKLSDSTAIIRYLDQQLDPPRPFVPDDARLAADVHLLEDWSDESLYWYGCYAKFVDSDGWKRVGPELSKTLPTPLRALGPRMARRKYRQALRTQGVLRRSREQIEEEFERHLAALETRLGSNPYLLGADVTLADLSIAAMLGQLTVGLTPRFGEIIARYAQMSAYLQRMREETRTIPQPEVS